MTQGALIDDYHARLTADDQAICAKLRRAIDAALPDAEAKVWHGHPVWFLDGNPLAGYSRLKDGIQLLFWSGQDFGEEGLKGEGKFRAAAARFTSVAEIDDAVLGRWLARSRDVQWDYKNIVKRKGVLERLT